MPEQLQQTARDIMSVDVPTLSRDASVENAVTLLAGRDIAYAVIVDGDGGPAGMITEGDLLALAQRDRKRPGGLLQRMLQEEHHLADTMRELRKAIASDVADVMSAPVESVTPDTPIARIAALMEAYDYRQLPVVEDGRLLGIVTRQDIVRAIADRP